MGGIPDSTTIRIPEHATPHGRKLPYVNYSLVSPAYFGTIGAQLLRGRNITNEDTLETVPVTIINRTLANKYFPGEDPIGKQIAVALLRYPLRTIIGIVDDIKQESLREESAPEMFVPYTQNKIQVWPSMQALQYALRTEGDPASVLAGIEKAVHSVDPDLPVAKLATVTTLVSNSLTPERLSMLLVGSFGVFALLLACIGMYGVISYSVMQRTTEIGVRRALGAERIQIFLMIIGQGARLIIAGIFFGLVAALASTRLMAHFLYGVGAADPMTFGSVTVLLIAVALLACYVPASQAMKAQPIKALRHQ